MFEFGSGVDFRLIRFLGLRAVRDFVSGNPGLNVGRLDLGKQHNVISSGAVVFHF
jgi:hypothetical protein